MLKPLSLFTILLAITATFGLPVPIKVIDIDNMQPVPGVYIYDNEGGIDSTDADGRVLVPELNDASIVLFKHPLYQTKQIRYRTLVKRKNVKLAPAGESTEESIATAYRFSEKKDAVPNQALTITKKNFELYNPRTTADLLTAFDEVYFPKSLPGGGGPMIRGFSGGSLLLFVDGVRVNNAIGKSDNLQNILLLDPGAVESADVLFGPGSTLYGSDAMGGVMNFHFREPVPSADSAVEKSGTAMGRFSLADLEKSGSVNYNLGTKNLASFTAVSFGDFGDLRMGKSGEHYAFYSRKNYVRERIRVDTAGTIVDTVVGNSNPDVQNFSGYRQISALEKLRFAASEKLTLGGSVYFSATGPVPRYDRLIENIGSPSNPVFRFAEWYYGPQRWLLGTVALDYTSPFLLFNQAKVTLAYQNDKETCHHRIINNNWLTDSTETVNVLSGNIDCSKPVGQRSVLAYGVEAAVSTVSSTAGKNDIITGQTGYSGTRYPDGYNDYATGALYGYFRTSWNPAVTSVAGARYSRIYLHSYQNDALYKSPEREMKINTGTPSGCLGVIVRPFDFWRITLNGSTGFRAPNIDDLGRIFSPVTGYIRVPNSGLQPEYSYSIDLGNGVALGKYIDVNAVFFATHVENLMAEGDFTYNGQESIVYEGATYMVRSLINKGSANIGGGTMRLGVNFFDGLSLKNAVSITAGMDSDTMPLRAAPPLFGASHLLFQYDRIKGDLFVRFNGKKTEGIEIFDMAVNDQNEPFLYPTDEAGAHFSPSWYTVNLATTVILLKSLDCNLAVENILDKCYYQYAGGIVAPGRNIALSVRWKF